TSYIKPKTYFGLGTTGHVESKHYSPKNNEVIEFLNSNFQFPRKTANAEELAIRCPACRPRKGTYYTARIRTDKGTFKCTECETVGLWYEYTRRFNDSELSKLFSTIESLGFRSNFSKPKEEIERYSTLMKDYPEIIKWFEKSKGLTQETLEAFKVGVAKYHNIDPSNSLREEFCITFPRSAPYYNRADQIEPDNQIVRIKAWSTESEETIAFDPPGTVTGLFGYHLVPHHGEEVILAGSEFDAMAAYQETKIPSTCLPHNSYQLSIEVLPLLERFSKIYLWFDDDVAGQDAAEKFAEKLGIERCLIVKTLNGQLDGPVNAQQALEAGKDLKEIIKSAKPLQHEQIIGFECLRDSVYRELVNPDQVQGIQSIDLPGLNQVLKGHRRGELTIFTGTTGVGKTTVLSQLSLDYCRSGVNTLWGSFEIPNVRLAKKMLQQFAGKALTLEKIKEFPLWAEKFQQLPMYFLKFFGSTELTKVTDAMEHAIYAFDVQHIIIDNLQFMLAEQARYHNDRWELQDRTVGTFRRIATERNVHITLVVHPKKDEREFLDLNSIFGSAKVTQEADNVIILQRRITENGEIRYLDIKKNRFDGTLAAIPFEFDHESLKIRQLTKVDHDSRLKTRRKAH
ncbi:10805_t:CDS:2, partial [Paraglomus occultum]